MLTLNPAECLVCKGVHENGDCPAVERAGPPTARDEPVTSEEVQKQLAIAAAREPARTYQYDTYAITTPNAPAQNAPCSDPGPNPKTLMGQKKVPMLSVIPPSALAYLGMALRYGAYESLRVDGSRGYGPFNWRDQKVEVMTYVDATIRHLLEFVDGEYNASDSNKPHLAHAMASLAILADAIENDTFIDNRPSVRKAVATALLEREARK